MLRIVSLILVANGCVIACEEPPARGDEDENSSAPETTKSKNPRKRTRASERARGRVNLSFDDVEGEEHRLREEARETARDGVLGGASADRPIVVVLAKVPGAAPALFFAAPLPANERARNRLAQLLHHSVAQESLGKNLRKRTSNVNALSHD
jgi:hypothetical protein